MEPTEIAFRIRQAVSKRRMPRTLRSLAAWSGTFAPAGSRFPRLPERMDFSETMRRGIADEAATVSSGRWPMLHGLTAETGPLPDWHRDYLAGISFGAGLPYQALNHRSLPPGMDVRVVWEINRWAHLVRLAQDAWLRRDPEAAQKVVGLIASWLESNPPGTGLNWTSSLEVALRLLNLAWLDALLLATLPDRTAWETLRNRLLPAHVWWTWEFRSPGSSANNHLLGELAGLLVALLRWPEGENFSTPATSIEKILHSEILRQFAPDGGNREQALHYHFFAWEISLQALCALRQAGRSIPEDVSDRMRRAAAFWLAVEGGEESWDYGDSDDAIVVPLGGLMNPLPAWRGWLAEGRGEPGTWLNRSADFLQPVSTPETPSHSWQIFSDSGYAVRHEKPVLLRVDASPLGYLAGAGHGHLDALHLSVWINGRAFLVDPGTGGYYANPTERSLLAAAESHNGPFVPGADYPIRKGPFLWQHHHPTPALHLDPEDLLHAELKLGKQTELRRQIAMQNEGGKARTLAVSDSASGHPERLFHVRWILAPSWQMKDRTANGATFTRDDWQVEFSAGTEWETVKVSDPRREDPGGSLVSPAFRQFEHGLLVHLAGKQDGLPHTSHWKIHGL